MLGSIPFLVSIRHWFYAGSPQRAEPVAAHWPASSMSVRSVTALGLVMMGITCGTPSRALATERATAEEAQAMLARAAARFAEVGKSQALDEFTNDKAHFSDRDLYVFCMNLSDGRWTAHGANKVLVGRDVVAVKDADGKSVGQAILTAVQDQPSAVVRYKWPDPITRKVAPKLTYLQKVGDQVCAVGIYEFQDPS